MSVVKDVDLEAMPTSIFLNDDDDDEKMIKQCAIANQRCKCSRVRNCKNKNIPSSRLKADNVDGFQIRSGSRLHAARPADEYVT